MVKKGKITIVKASDSMVELKDNEMNILRGGGPQGIPGCRKLCGRCLIRIGCNRNYGMMERADLDSQELSF